MTARTRLVRLSLVAGAVLVACGVVAALLHAPFARAMVFRQMTEAARARFGIELAATSFDYSLGTLTVTLENLSAAAARTPDVPFLQIGHLRARLGWKALLGRADLTELDLDSPRLDLRYGGDREGNLPEVQAPGTAMAPLEFFVGELTMTGFDAVAGSRPAADTVTVRDMSLQARGPGPNRLDGRLVAAGGLSISTGNATVVIERAEADFSFDGRTFSLKTFVAEAAGGRATAGGEIVLLGESPRFDVGASWEFDVARAANWFVPKWPMGGRATVNATVTGPIASPRLGLEAHGRHLNWRTLHASTVEARFTVDAAGASVESVDATIGEGRVRARGRLGSPVTESNRADVRWTAIDLSAVAAAFDPGAVQVPPAPSTGEAELSWESSGPVLASLSGRIEATVRPGTPPGVGEARFTAVGSVARWDIELDHRFGDGAVVEATTKLAVDPLSPARSRLDGGVSFRSPRLAATLARLAAFGIRIPEALHVDLSGPATVEASLDGTLADPQVSGAAKIGDSAVAGAGPVTAHAVFLLDRRALALDRLLLEAPATKLELRGTLGFRGVAGQGSFEVTTSDVARLAERVPDAWRPHGALQASGRWSGPVRDLRVELDIAGSDLTVGTTPLALEGHAVYDDGVVTIERTELRQDATSLLRIGGRVNIDGTGLSLDVGGRLGQVGPVPLSGSASAGAIGLGAVQLSMQIDGSAQAPAGMAHVAVESLSWNGRDLGPFETTITRDDGPAHVTASAPRFALTLDAQVDVFAPHAFAARVLADDTSLGKVVTGAGWQHRLGKDTDGTARFTADLVGTLDRPGDTEAHLDLQAMEGRILGLPVRVTRPAQARLARATLEVDDLAADVGGIDLRITGGTEAPAGMRASVSGPLDAVSSVLARIHPSHAWKTSGSVTADFVVRGTVEQPEVTGAARLTLTELTRDARVIAQDVVLDASLGADRLSVRNASGTVFGGACRVEGDVPIQWVSRGWQGAAVDSDRSPPVAASLVGRVSFDVPTMAQAFGRPLPPTLEGTVEAVVRLEAHEPSLDAVVGEIVLEQAQVVTGDRRVSQVQPGRLFLRGGRLVVDSLELEGEEGRMIATGHWGVAPGTETALEVRSTVPLGVFDAFYAGRATGVAQATLRLVGPAGATKVTGSVELEDASLLMPGNRVALAGWAGTVRVSDDGVDIADLRGQLNGGDVVVSGRLPSLSAQTTVRAPEGLQLIARHVFLEVPRGLRSQVDADLTWQRSGSDTTIRGVVTMTSGTYREPVTRMLELVDTLTPTRGDGGDARSLPAAIEAIGLDVQLQSTDPVVIDNSLGRIELTPDVRVRGTLGAPALEGSIGTLEDGRLYIGGRAFRLRDSRLRFSPANGIVPTLDVTGETRVGEYEVSLRLLGNPDHIETIYTSDPPLSERDLRSLLVTGRTEADLPGRRSGDDFAVGAASSDVLGLAGKFVGLDSVRLGAADLELVASDVKPTQSLTVSKTIGSSFELIASEDLEDNKLTWVVVWRPSRSYQVRVASRENTDQSIELRQEIQFGPGARSPKPAAPSSRRSTRDVRVSAVTFDGQPGFSPDQLRKELSLAAGAAFDFRKWINDRERLERFYRDRGYAAVRVVPRRRDISGGAGEAQVGLDYQIERGPATQIEVQGAQLPDAIRDEMRASWANASLADFVREDAVRIASRHLALSGYLRASVVGTVVVNSAARHHILVTIEPGPRTARRRVEFLGNAAITSGELADHVTRRDLHDAVWVDGAAFIRDMNSLYASRGFLRAQIALGPPVFDGDVATQPVLINEGPVARVASVSVDGVDVERREGVVAALGMPVGAEYVWQAEQGARRRIEAHLRDLGFRAGQVAVTADVAKDGARVAIAARIDEGPRSVVRTVEVTGVQSTRRGLVDRAITLKPGQAASATAAAETRRRLYDVGVFRSADVRFDDRGSPDAPAPDVPVDAIVAVEELRRFQLRYGVEVSQEYEPAVEQHRGALGAAVDLRDRNFLGLGIAAGIGARYEPNLRSLRSLFSAPTLLNRPIRTNLYFTERRETTTAGDIVLVDDQTDVTIEQRWRVRPKLELSWGYSYGWRDIGLSVRQDSTRLLEFAGVLSGPTGSAVVDFRDSPFDATRGWFHSSSLQMGTRALGSDVDYIRYLARQFHYQPVGPITLATGLRWGTLSTFGGLPPINILDLLFTAGGATTVRGYREESLSAIDFFGVSLGGTDLLVLNGELRFPIVKWVKGVVFADAGNTFSRRSQIRLEDLAVGVGFGLRVKTPFAPIRIDLGFPVPRRPGDPRARWHFSIGQMF